MRHVKSEYEMCSKRYQNTMGKISQAAATNHNVDQRNASAAAAAAAASDGVDGIKAVCW